MQHCKIKERKKKLAQCCYTAIFITSLIEIIVRLGMGEKIIMMCVINVQILYDILVCLMLFGNYVGLFRGSRVSGKGKNK